MVIKLLAEVRMKLGVLVKMSSGLDDISKIFLVSRIVICTNDKMALQSAKICLNFLQDLINTLRRYVLREPQSLLLGEFEMFSLRTK